MKGVRTPSSDIDLHLTRQDSARLVRRWHRVRTRLQSLFSTRPVVARSRVSRRHLKHATSDVDSQFTVVHSIVSACRVSPLVLFRRAVSP